MFSAASAGGAAESRIDTQTKWGRIGDKDRNDLIIEHIDEEILAASGPLLMPRAAEKNPLPRRRLFECATKTKWLVKPPPSRPSP
jgi:hypothetical protein